MKAPGRQTLQTLLYLGIFCLISTRAPLAQNAQHPASGYLEAKLLRGLDAGHAQVGQEFQARMLDQWNAPDCTLLHNARIYGTIVTVARHTKSSPQSSLGLLIESADCEDHPHTALALHILEITTPDSLREPLHSVLPIGSGGMSTAPITHDDNTAPDEASSSVRIGAVLGEIPMRLEIAGGPRFADVLYSDKRNVSLLSGSRLVLGTPDMVPADQQVHFQPTQKEP